MTTSPPSSPGGTSSPGPRSTWSAPDSPASPSPTPATARRRRTRAGSGRRLPDAFAYYDPAWCSWRTSQGSFAEGWARFSGTWPASGMTRSGTAWRRPMSARRTFAAGSSSSPTPADAAPGWPTPTVSRSRSRTARRKPGSRHHDGVTLLDAVRLWPTAAAADADRQSSSYPRGNQTLAGAARWPTPAAANPNDRETLASWQQRRRRERAKGRNGNGMGTPLAVAVRLWPTPKASDGSGKGGTGRDRGRRSDLPDRVAQAQGNATLLNPAWVEALMGLPQGWTLPPAGWSAPRRSRAGRRRQATPSTTGSRPAPSKAASPTAPAGSPPSATPSSPRSPRSPAAGH